MLTSQLRLPFGSHLTVFTGGSHLAPLLERGLRNITAPDRGALATTTVIYEELRKCHFDAFCVMGVTRAMTALFRFERSQSDTVAEGPSGLPADSLKFQKSMYESLRTNRPRP